MLIPHLHFNGNCAEAIKLYEQAFNTKADTESIDYTPDGMRIAHAVINIHGGELFLNDGLEHISGKFNGVGCSAHLIVTFNTTDELLACYEILKPAEAEFPFSETSYSKMSGNFLDKFGILWGFIAN